MRSPTHLLFFKENHTTKAVTGGIQGSGTPTFYL